MAIVTPGSGIAVQYRSSRGGASQHVTPVAGTAPAWVRLSISTSDHTFTSAWSADGEHWTTLGTVTVNFAASEFYIGLPVSSHNTTTATSAVFDEVTVTNGF
jgi:cytochrome c